jgi:hypothetical protein
MVASSLTVVSTPVSAYGDGDKITYRVTAINGVGIEARRESDSCD